MTRPEALNILAAAGVYSLLTGKYQDATNLSADTKRKAVEWGQRIIPNGDAVPLICKAVEEYFGFNPDFI